MKIIRGELTPDAIIPPLTRYDATCNCIQVTTDGGATWQHAVGQDPRSQPAYLKPALVTADPRCDAAANMTAWVKSVVDSLIAAMSAGATDLLLANNLVQFIEQCFPYAAYFIQLMFELAIDVLAVGADDLNTAFNSTTYDQLTCIFYCHMGSDGQVSASQVLDIGADVVAILNTTAALVVGELLFITGFVGLSNVGATGSETGDCASCGCGWTWEWDFTVDDGGFVARTDIGVTVGHYVAGVGWQPNVHNDGCNNHQYDYLFLDFGFSIDNATAAEYEFAVALGNLTVDFYDQQTGTSITQRSAAGSGFGTIKGFTFSSVTYDRSGITLNNCDDTTGWTLTKHRLSGDGTPPAFTTGHRIA